MTKPTKWLCAKRGLKSAWAFAQSDQSLRCALNGYLRTQAFFMRTAKTDQTGRMPRLIRVFAGRTCHFVGFVVRRLLITTWTASSEFGTNRLCEQRRFRRACASAQSRQNLRCSLIQAVSQAEPSDRKPDPWPLWMAGHAQLKFVMTECSKTQIRLTGLTWQWHCQEAKISYKYSPTCIKQAPKG